MLVSNIELSYIMVLRKYTNFVSFLSCETRNVPLIRLTNLQSKIRDANKRETHSRKLIPKSPHTAQDSILK